MKNSILLFVCFFMILFSSCDKSLDSEIPSLPVYLSVRIDHNNLTTAGSYKSFTTRPDASSYIGFGGVLIIRGYEAENNSVYAYDLACPYEKNNTIRVTINSDNVAECKKCGSLFNGIFWGSPAPSSGPAFDEKLFLRRYNAFIKDFDIIVAN